MTRSSIVRSTLLFVLGTTSATLGVVACVSDDPAPVAPGPDGSLPDVGTTPTDSGGSTNPDDGSTPVDSGDPDAGEVITDGGDLPPEEEDGGVTDPDGGFDAGPACAPLTPGAYVTSTCASISILPAGGDLVSGTYVLDSVVVLGTTTFCGAGGGFAAYDHRGVLEVTATSTSSATFELLDQYKKAGAIARYTTVRYDAIANASKSTLTYTPQACAVKPAPASGPYTAGTLKGGKRYITLRLPYGAKGTANYRFVQQ